MPVDTLARARPNSESPDHDVAIRFAAKDPSALRTLYDDYGGSMLSAALHLLGGDRSLAEEAVHTAMLKAWQAAASFDPARPLAPWLFAIVRHCAIDVGRRERRHQVHSLDAAVHEPADPGVDGIESAWEAWIVRQALHDLPDEEHSVMRLAYYERLTHSEIASRLSIPIGTVKSRTARAHARLRVSLCPRFARAS